ncbi:MAG: tetratricopeptide repeat protein [Acidobacteriota bacterium]
MNRRWRSLASGAFILALALWGTASGVRKIGFFVHRFGAENALEGADLVHAHTRFMAAARWAPGDAANHVLIARVMQLALANGLAVTGKTPSAGPDDLLLEGLQSVSDGIDRNPADAWGWFRLADLARGFQAGRHRLERLRRAGTTRDPAATRPDGVGSDTGFEPEDRLIVAATRKAMRLEPEFYFYHDYLAALYWERGLLDAARAETETSFALMPIDTSHGLLSRREGMLGSLADAALRGLERGQAHPLITTEMVALSRASLLEGLDRDEEAISALEAVQSQAHGRFAAEVNLRIGILLYKQRRYAESLPYLERVLTLDGDGDLGTRALYPLGIGRSRTGDHRRALASLRKYLGRYPSAVRSYIALAAAYRRAGQPSDAESLYRAALQRFPSDESVHYQWVTFLIEQERLDEALEASRDFERLVPGDGAHRLTARIERDLAGGGP